MRVFSRTDGDGDTLMTDAGDERPSGSRNHVVPYLVSLLSDKQQAATAVVPRESGVKGDAPVHILH